MKNPKLILLLSAMLVVCFALWAATRFLQIRADATLHPVQSKVGDFSGNSLRAIMTIPEGAQFAFVLGLPTASHLSRDLEGRITVELDGVVYSESFALADLKPCNWLDQAGLHGHIITWHNDPSRLDAVLQTGRTYTVFCEVKPQLTAAMSLWITYLQDWQTYRRSH